MAITDKTRKILWGRSGSLCAFCRRVLVVDKTAVDADAVVGDECHIVSSEPKGPRHDPGVTRDFIDSVENLILLCKVHHKQVDDQACTYPAEILRAIKSEHEAWVSSRLIDAPPAEPVRIRRFKKDVPRELYRVVSGSHLYAQATSCSAYYHHVPDDLSEHEVEVVGELLQSLLDYADIDADFEVLDRLHARKQIGDRLLELEGDGLGVFTGLERQQLTGGTRGTPSDWYALHIAIARLAATDAPEGE